MTEDLHRRQSEARFRSLVAHSSDLITVLDGDGIVTYQSPSIERVLGYSVEEIEGTPFDRLLLEADRTGLSQVITGVGREGSEAHVIDCSLRHRDGRWLQFEVQHADLLAHEHVRGIVLNSRDVSERKLFEDQLAHQAFHDSVTDLANRPLFSDRVQHALARAQRSGTAVAVMFIDLDEFKTVNDSLGHPAGDRVLREVASRLSAAIRPTDTVARFGGDEFAVLLDGVTDLADAADAAARLLRALEAEFQIDGKQVFPRASIGICLVEPGGPPTSAEELLRNADVAMYIGQARLQGELPRLRAGNARAGARAAGVAFGPAAGDRPEPARGPLSADRPPAAGRDLRRRGAAPVDAPDAREHYHRTSSSRLPRRAA